MPCAQASQWSPGWMAPDPARAGGSDARRPQQTHLPFPLGLPLSRGAQRAPKAILSQAPLRGSASWGPTCVQQEQKPRLTLGVLLDITPFTAQAVAAPGLPPVPSSSMSCPVRTGVSPTSLPYEALLPTQAPPALFIISPWTQRMWIPGQARELQGQAYRHPPNPTCTACSKKGV